MEIFWVKRSKNGVTIEQKDKRTSITLKNVSIGEFTQTVSLKNFQSIILIYYFLIVQHITSSLFRIPDIYVALKEVAKVQVEIADRERIIFTDSLEKSRDLMFAILPSLISSKIKRECNGCFTSHQHKPNTRVLRKSAKKTVQTE